MGTVPARASSSLLFSLSPIPSLPVFPPRYNSLLSSPHLSSLLLLHSASHCLLSLLVEPPPPRARHALLGVPCAIATS
eukprot:765203-Hanusia_phi.AAC.12